MINEEKRDDLKKDGLKIILLLVFFTFLYVFPLFSFLIYLIWPIPIVYFIEKYDIKKGVVVILLSAIINIALFSLINSDISNGVIIGMYSIIGFGLIGFLLGSAIKERLSPLKTLIITIIAVFSSNLLQTYIFRSAYQEIWESLILYFKEQLGEENIFMVEKSFSLARLITPVSILILSILIGTMIYYITIFYMKKQGTSIKSYKPFREWSFPRWPISVFTAVLLVVLFIQERVLEPGILNTFLFNLLIFLLFLVFLQGLAVIIYFLTIIKSGFLKAAVIITLFFVSLLLYGLPVIMIMIIGLIDMWFNLRKVKTE